MVFDPVRDAILNSPERTTYSDPFEEFEGTDAEREQQDRINKETFREEEEEDTAGEDSQQHFRPPSQTDTHNDSPNPPLLINSSPDRSYSSYEVAQTPGGPVPPTPFGGVPSTASFYTPVAANSASEQDALGPSSNLERPAGVSRHSSIFSLLSPEPPGARSSSEGNDNERSRSTSQGYFDNAVQYNEEPQELVDRGEGGSGSVDHHLVPNGRTGLIGEKGGRPMSGTGSSSRPNSSGSAIFSDAAFFNRSSMPPPAVPSTSAPPAKRSSQTLSIPAPPPRQEPAKRGRLYAPFKRVNGPPPKSLYIPFTPDEYEYYTNPANCRNPLREGSGIGVGSETRQSREDSPDSKGKGKAAEEYTLPSDIDIAPGYAPPTELDPSLLPEPIVRPPKASSRPGSRNGSGGNGGPGAAAKKRKRDSIPNNDIATTKEYTEVASHYNKRLNFSREERVNSPIIGLKSFNNWVKSVLIAKYARYDPKQDPNSYTQSQRGRRPPLKVLDLGCGKGGDLQKWQKAGLREYVGVDIAEVSVEQARERWQNLRPPKFDASFYALDCFSNPLSVLVPSQVLSEPLFDVVTMQFCMHYAFQSVSKARMMLENVSRYLRRGGTFLGTIPDSAQLLQNLRDIPEDASSLTFGNAVYHITFDDRSKFPAFGHRYTFYLQDAVEDVPEYVVQWDAFESLALEYGLKVVYHATFHELFNAEREHPDFANLLIRMKVVTPDGESELTEEQWEAANIYVAFAFTKVR